MTHDLVAVTQELIRYRSIPAYPEELEAILEYTLSHLHGFTLERFEDNGYKSILLYNTETRPERFTLLLNGHLDVIPGNDTQYEGRIEGDKLYGVGSMDMKANVACLISVFQEMAHKVSYPVALQLVTDEELGGFHGTRHQVNEGVRADFVITSESTNFHIVHKAKGVLWARVTARGKTAHGAYPWAGENAIEKMMEFLAALKNEFPNPTEKAWVSTVNIGAISTPNETFNKIPDLCEVALDIRFTPEESETIVKRLQGLITEELSLEIISHEPAMSTPEDDDYLTSLQEITSNVIGENSILYGAQGSSDARHFTAVGCGGVEFGPIGGGIGTDEEWVSISSLHTYCEILRRYMNHLDEKQ
ncbi:MAG: M20 family metallopeptidase [Bdellovibrionota bacterium]|jgi:succinyl-diaminopimelate desuccinylase